MSGIVLDAGAFVAVDRNDRAVLARLRVAQQRGLDLRTNSVVVAQVWRDRDGRQAQVGRLLRSVDIRSVDERTGRQAGILLGRAGTSDVVDATVVLLAQPGDRILTSDPGDIGRLVEVAGVSAAVVPC